jgi:precorrin-6B methylase 2
MPWYYAVAERDHELQNPISAAKILLLGERLRLTAASRVLDVGAGTCGPAVVLAREFDCRVTAIERAPEFVASARARIAAAGVAERIDVVEQDATETALEPEVFDVAMCLGASFVWNGLDGTLAALAPAVRRAGAVVVGEPYWRRWPLPDGIDGEGFVALPATADRFAAAGLPIEAMIVSSEDDWDSYETLHWRAVEEWLAANPNDPDGSAIRDRHEAARATYLGWRRDLLGWAIFAGRKR